MRPWVTIALLGERVSRTLQKTSRYAIRRLLIPFPTAIVDVILRFVEGKEFGMKTKISILLAALCVSAACVMADTPRLEFGDEIKVMLNEPVRLIAEKDGFRLLSVPPRLRVSVGALKTGDGGGGDVAGLSSTQVSYSDPVDGNVVLLVWVENTLNPSGVNIYVNDALIGDVPGLPVPGVNLVSVAPFPPGLFKLRVESIDDGSVSEVSQLFLAAQPFSDAMNLSCSPGDIAGPGSCSIEASWDNPGPLPDEYVVLLNGAPLGSLPGDSLGVIIDGVSPGAHLLTVIGFKSDADGNGDYRGEFIETLCVVTCEPAAVPALDGVFALALIALMLGLGAVALRRTGAVDSPT